MARAVLMVLFATYLYENIVDVESITKVSMLFL